jgi:DegV family protein with EDD domain
MANTALVTDSTSNLPHTLAADRKIYIAPLYVMWGEEMFQDGVDLTEAEFYRRLRDTEELPKTSQVSVQDFVELFQMARQLEKADEVVCAVISSELSGTHASAIQASEMVDFPVHVIDSLQVSWALGFPMLSAADARDAGGGPQTIVQAIQDAIQRQHPLFTIENLEHLHRGGRIGNARLLLGSALRIKPVLALNKGIVDLVENVRTRKRALAHLLQDIADHAAGRDVARLAVVHGDVEDEAQTLLDEAIERFSPAEQYLSYATPVMGVHTGPEAIGIIAEYAAG